MTIVTAEPFVISDRPEVLEEIRGEDCSLAVWRRDTPVDVHSLMQNSVENLRIMVHSDSVEPFLREALDSCGFVKNAEREDVTADILNLCAIFHKLTDSPSIEIRLEAVTGNSCWKFHSDFVQMRLITTYLGRGTQWIDDRKIDRAADDIEPEEINELETGDVGLFKGRLGKGQPAIHRSPPIDGSGKKRLLLVLNPVED